MSLAIAYSLGGVLAAAGIVLSLVYAGSALATTAIGTLIPILSDTGELRTRFGTYLLAAGAVGEFGPILLLTLVLSTQSALHNALILLAFVALAVGVARAGGALGGAHPAAVRADDREELPARGPLDRRPRLRARAGRRPISASTCCSAGSPPGSSRGRSCETREVPAFDSKLTAVAFGVFIPFFFVMSGMRLDIDALFASAVGRRRSWRSSSCSSSSCAARRRSCSTAACSRAQDRMALALFTSTQLPLVVAITTVAVDERPHALLDRRRPRRRRRAVDARRPAPRPAHAADRGAERAPPRPPCGEVPVAR